MRRLRAARRVARLVLTAQALQGPRRDPTLAVYDATVTSQGLLALRDLCYGADPLVLAVAIRGGHDGYWLDSTQKGAALRRVARELA